MFELLCPENGVSGNLSRQRIELAANETFRGAEVSIPE